MTAKSFRDTIYFIPMDNTSVCNYCSAPSSNFSISLGLACTFSLLSLVFTEYLQQLLSFAFFNAALTFLTAHFWNGLQFSLQKWTKWPLRADCAEVFSLVCLCNATILMLVWGFLCFLVLSPHWSCGIALSDKLLPKWPAISHLSLPMTEQWVRWCMLGRCSKTLGSVALCQISCPL